MNLFAWRNISLVLMLAAFPLISLGTTGDQPALWWAGLTSLLLGSLVPPVLRFVPADKGGEGDEAAEATEDQEELARRKRKNATDLGDSCRVG